MRMLIRRFASLRGVIFLGLGLRLAAPAVAYHLTGSPAIFQEPDSRGYQQLAYQLAETGRFSLAGEPEVVRTPGYPLLIVPGALLGFPVLVTIVVQAFVSVAAVGLVYGIALALFANQRVALLAALLQAIEPMALLYSGKILTESLFTTALLAFIYLLMGYLRESSRIALSGAAVFLAVSAYVRPIAVYLPIVIATLLCFAGSRRRGVAAGILFFCLSTSLIGAWSLRNGLQSGYWGFSSVSDVALYFYHGAAVTADVEGRSFADIQKDIGHDDWSRYFEQHPEQAAWPKARQYDYMRTEGLRICRDHPREFLGIYMTGILRALLNPDTPDYLEYFGHEGPGGYLTRLPERGVFPTLWLMLRNDRLLLFANVALAAEIGFLWIAGTLGALLAWKGPFQRLMVAVPMIVTIYIVGLSGGVNGTGRFRVPILPVLAVFAAYATRAICPRTLRPSQSPP